MIRTPSGGHCQFSRVKQSEAYRNDCTEHPVSVDGGPMHTLLGVRVNALKDAPRPQGEWHLLLIPPDDNGPSTRATWRLLTVARCMLHYGLGRLDEEVSRPMDTAKKTHQHILDSTTQWNSRRVRRCPQLGRKETAPIRRD